MSKSKKKWLGVVTFLGAVFLFLANGLKVLHWNNIGWVCQSHHPWLPFASWGGMIMLLVTIYLTPAKEHWYIKVVAAMWFAMNILLSYCVLNTYWVI